MNKKTSNAPIYAVFGVVVFFLVLLMAGNLAYYHMDGLTGIQMAMRDFSHFQFHFGNPMTQPVYKNYYLGSVLVYILVITAFTVNEGRYKRDAAGIEAGSAKWHDQQASFNKRYADPIGKSASNGPFNMILSQNVRLSLNDFETGLNNNVLIIGGAGTGKTRYIIKPNLMQENASFICTDPSGELLASLGRDMRDQGYKIKVFNLENMLYSNFYNPFVYIRSDAGIGILVDCFLDNTTPPEKSSSDPFWEKSEKALLTACIYYLRDFCAIEDQNFATILYMIQLAQIDEFAKVKTSSGLDKLFDGEAKIVNGKFVPLENKDEIESTKKKIDNSLAWKNYQTFRIGGVKTIKSVLISAAVRLNPFLVPELANLTSRDTLGLDKIGDEKTALFIIIPQANKTYNFIAAMMYAQMFDSLYYKAERLKPTDEYPDQEYLRLKFPVRFMLDEFRNIGKIPEFPEKIATCRKYNISCTIVLQSLAQIKAMYKDDYETIIANCSSAVLLGTNEQGTAEYISKQLGKTTIRARSSGLSRGGKSSNSFNFQQTGRDLMSPDEIRAMPNDECLVFVQGEKPFRDKKFDIKKHPRFSYTADGNEKMRFLIEDGDEFLNIKTKEYDKMAVSVEESEEAEETVSKPKDAADVVIDSGKGTNSTEAKFFGISDTTRRKALDYTLKAITNVEEGFRKNVKEFRDAKVLYHVEYSLDPRYAPGLVMKMFSEYKKPVILFCGGMKDGLLDGYYVECNNEISEILMSYEFTNITELSNKQENGQIILTLFCVKGITQSSYSSLCNALRIGEDLIVKTKEVDDFFKEISMY